MFAYICVRNVVALKLQLQLYKGFQNIKLGCALQLTFLRERVLRATKQQDSAYVMNVQM